VLAIDTALGACAAAVLDTAYGGILASESQPMVRGHAEALCQKLGYYHEEEPGRRSAAKSLTKDETRRIAANVAKLAELLLNG